ncbi:MAG: hypothetical protein ACOCP9_05550 [Halofilum sp. (in: g-proteobacteria)]
MTIRTPLAGPLFAMVAPAAGDRYLIPRRDLQRHTPGIFIGMERMCEQLDQARG